MDDFRKSSFSVNDGACVEVGNGVRVRDTKDEGQFTLRFTVQAWREFISQVKG